MAKRKVLGADPLDWIKPTTRLGDKEPQNEKEELNHSISEIASSTIAARTSKSPGVPKFQTYEVKLTLRLKENQLEFLSRLEREIMKKRSRPNRSERITKNSILRAMIDSLKNLDMDTSEIRDETELINRFKKAIGLKRGG